MRCKAHSLAALVIIFFASPSLLSQGLVAELSLPGTPSNIQGMMTGDDIFLSLNMNTVPKAYFIRPDGSRQEINMHFIGSNPVAACVRVADSTFIYYLETIDKRTFISSKVVSNSTGEGTKLSFRTDVPGSIYGSYVDGEELFMLCAIRKEYKLTLLRFRNGQLASESVFPLTFDLGKRRGRRVSFIDARYPTTPQQAAADVKIVRDGGYIWIMIDEPARDHDATLTENSIFRTTVVKIDLATATTTVKSFYETGRHPFTSAVLNGNLYRLTMINRSLRIDQFNFELGRKVKSAMLERGTEPGRDSTYARISGRFKTEKDVKGAMIIKRGLGYLFIVDSLTNGDQILTVGNYGDHYVTMISPINVAGLIITASSLIVGEMVEGPISTVYFYYRGSMDNGFTATYHVPLLRKVIDDYDYKQLVNRVRFAFRGYIQQADATYEISQQVKSNVIEIRKFEGNYDVR